MPRATKKPKDPHAPKRNQTSYFIFSNERRPVLQAENKGMSVTNIAKVISAEWKVLTADQKKVYEKRAANQKAEYVKEMAEYQKTDNFNQFEKKLEEWKQTEKDLGRGPKGKTKAKRALKKPKQPESMPKKAQTSYFIFNNERRKELKEQYPDKKITELAKLIGGEWKTMTETEKAKYVEQAKTLKEQYEVKIAEFKRTDEYKTYMQQLDDWKKQQKEAAHVDDEASGADVEDDVPVKVSLPRKPKDAQCPKRPLSSYFLFAQEARAALKQEFPEKSVTDIAKEMSRKWKALSEEEKKPYNEGAARLKEQYKKDTLTYEGSEAQLEYKEKLEEWKQECARRKNAAKLKAQQKTEKRQPKKAVAKKGKASAPKGGKTAKKKSNKKRRKQVSEDEDSSASDSDSPGDSSSSQSSSSSDGSSSGSSDSDSESSSE